MSFFKQGFLKQLLTEGEKYMFTLFNLMTLSEQGIYDVIANLGSIPARLFFSKMEESAHLYFSQSVKRGHVEVTQLEKESAPTRHLHILLKSLIIFGLIVTTFGVFYSHLLLYIYGGELLTEGVGPLLLKVILIINNLTYSKCNNISSLGTMFLCDLPRCERNKRMLCIQCHDCG